MNCVYLPSLVQHLDCRFFVLNNAVMTCITIVALLRNIAIPYKSQKTNTANENCTKIIINANMVD